MHSSLNGVVIIVGNYGSGKTEIAVNLAIYHHLHLRTKVRIADLDLVNPYFRTREARKILTSLGVDVIVPPEYLLQADLPILMPQVAGALRAPEELTILDVGGDDAGASVLAALADVLKDIKTIVTMIQVVNPCRPKTESVEACLKICRAIEGRARMAVQKWVGNAHMLDETTIAHIYQGDAFMKALSESSDRTVAFITAPYNLIDQLDSTRLSWPVLPIYRQLVPPWRKADKPCQD